MLTFLLPTEKYLVVSFWTIFLNFSATKANEKEPRPPQIFVNAGYLSKVKLQFS